MSEHPNEKSRRLAVRNAVYRALGEETAQLARIPPADLWYGPYGTPDELA